VPSAGNVYVSRSLAYVASIVKQISRSTDLSACIDVDGLTQVWHAQQRTMLSFRFEVVHSSSQVPECVPDVGSAVPDPHPRAKSGSDSFASELPFRA
jgi:hypothetical protein